MDKLRDKYPYLIRFQKITDKIIEKKKNDGPN